MTFFKCDEEAKEITPILTRRVLEAEYTIGKLNLKEVQLLRDGLNEIVNNRYRGGKGKEAEEMLKRIPI